MLALVLSGAANYGSVQAGAVEALLNVGFKPDITVGTSAGALNAIQIASNPTLEGARQLGQMWEAAGESPIGKTGVFTGLSRLIAQQDSLFTNLPLVEFLKENLPQKLETFGQLANLHGVKAYAIAVCLDTAQVIAFGDHEDDRLLDGAMTSTAIPPYYPPWQVGERRFVDGGVAAKIPIRAAIERGASQIVALDVVGTLESQKDARGLIGISSYAVSLMGDYQAKMEVEWARSTGVALRVISLETPPDVPFWDYSQAKRLYRLGHKEMERSLESEPLRIYPHWRIEFRKWLSKIING